MRFLLVFVALLLSCPVWAAPRTPAKPVDNTYHGVTVSDPYQWLERGADPAVQRWSRSQNQFARDYLDKLPAKPWIAERLQQLLASPTTNYSSLTWRPGRLFYLKFQPPAEQPVLAVRTSIADAASERILFDPNAAAVAGSVSIDWFVPSRDGRLVALSISTNGSELGTLRIHDTVTGNALPDAIPRVHGPTAGGSAAWNSDGSVLYYTRYPAPGERPAADLAFFQQVFAHTVGRPVSEDAYETGREFPRIAEIQLLSSPDGRWLLASVANGDGGDFAHHLRDPAGRWQEVAGFKERIVAAEFGRDPLYIEAGKDDALYLLSRGNAPMGKILRMPLDSPDLNKAAVVLEQGTNAIRSFKPSASGLGVVLMDGGLSQFHFYDFGTKRRHSPKLGEGLAAPGSHGRPVMAVPEIVVAGGDQFLLRVESFLVPYAWWQFEAGRDDTVSATSFQGSTPADFGDVEVLRRTVPSADGTKVPLTILRRKGNRMDGQSPALLTGYGGYGISMEPRFSPARRIWLDQGGVIAIANLRGGGEYGEEWHAAGNRTRKQNVFDDFAACAQYLVRSNFTNPSKLAIEGGSNGGLLMGALLTQHPDLARAVVSHVGIYDMLRVELDPNGAFNTTEFGTVGDPDEFRALHAYSPYHHVVPDTPYPAVLFLTGENDGRVNPAHSRKMTARLQAATKSERPVLLRTSSTSGHGMGTALSEAIAGAADVYAFLFDQLGIDYSLIDRGPWSGAVTPTSVVVKARVASAHLKARLLVSTSPLLANPIKTDFVKPDTNRFEVLEFRVSGLKPGTQYHYALELDGRIERARRGQFRTFPAPGPASFSFAFASCARTGSTLDTFDRIREDRPLFFLHTGDFHYLDIKSNSRAKFRAGYETVLASPQQADLYRNVPIAYIWDDHDFGGNDSDGRSKSHEAARMTYEEFVPHYPLGFGLDGPIAQTFSVGRVKFILTDLRSQRDSPTNTDNASKTILGTAQKEWLKRQLLESNGTYPLICWVSSVPWIGTKGSNVYQGVRSNEFGYIHHRDLAARAKPAPPRRRLRPPVNHEDHWSVFSTERREIADFIKANGIRGVCILHGDSHMLAADDGSHSDYATGGGAPIPVMCGAPLDQEASLKGGPYSQGVYRFKAGEGGFGWMDVVDRGDRIDVAYSGRDNKNTERISLKFSVPASLSGGTKP